MASRKEQEKPVKRTEEGRAAARPQDSEGEETPVDSVRTDSEGEVDLKDAVKTVTVRAANPARTGLWERAEEHKAAGHESGEVFVSGDKSERVASTTAVQAAISSGQLVEEGGEEAPEE
jgi:hypothetical protein